ncbi:hypothetical protein L484_016898 [Morus notabilis]|uniref:DYW domain-containing protein n=1 Tax=Morus notabilis TaxID=981085 RepID=W9S3L6_9ROSA|nr:putative pentatricopeptide repeat-containing protein At1g56570 [Morus notabilis]EXC12968.1 hypothetical protein L484_016898 [Morus notabilis]
MATVGSHGRVHYDLPIPSVRIRSNPKNASFGSLKPWLISHHSKFGNFYSELRLQRKIPSPESMSTLGVLSSNQSTMDFSMSGDLIKDHVDSGFPEDALKVFVKMLECGFPLDEFRFFPVLIKAFGVISDVEKVREIHVHLVKLGVLDDIYVANSLLGVYWKCGEARDAIQLFWKMPKKDSVSWNTMISGFCRSGDYMGSLRMFSQMIREHGVLPNRVACLSALSSCSALKSLLHGKEIHAFVLKSGLDLDDDFLISGLADMYMKCRDVKNAGYIFEGILDKEAVRENAVIWNVMILGYVSNGYFSQAVELFVEMLESGILPESSTMVAVLVLCSGLLDLAVGKQIHGFAISHGLDKDVRVETALIDMYFKCGYAKAGLDIFKTSLNRNIVMWGAAISNCAQSGLPSEALDLFHNYRMKNGFADSLIVLAALRACSSLTLKSKGLEIHGLVVKSGFGSDVFIGGALVDMYAKCRDIESAEKVFYRLLDRDLITWNALISGYAQNGCPDEALKAIHDMQSERITPNSVTSACVLSVCAHLSAMTLCKEVHGYLLRRGFGSNDLISNSLIATYAKCGDINSSRTIFRKMPEKNEVSWNSVFLGLGMHGHADEVFVLFEEMEESGMKPDHATFTALLSACSHAGRLEEGFKYFRSMVECYKLEPQLEPYTCMVDLLGRAGQLKQAYDMILAMPCAPDDRIWGSLLAACKSHGDRRLAEVVADHILELDPTNIGYRILLSNLYEDYGKWEEVNRVRTEIKDMGLKKSPGCSWIEVDNDIHTFVAGDRSHHHTVDIYDALERLTLQIRKAGYVPQSPLVTVGPSDVLHKDLTSTKTNSLLFLATARDKDQAASAKIMT